MGEAFPRAGHWPRIGRKEYYEDWQDISDILEGTKGCKNCERLGVTDSSNIYVSCMECTKWKSKLQGR